MKTEVSEYKYVIKVTLDNGETCYYNGGNYCLVYNPYLASRYKTTENNRKDIEYVEGCVEGSIEFAEYETEYSKYLEIEKKQRLLYDEC